MRRAGSAWIAGCLLAVCASASRAQPSTESGEPAAEPERAQGEAPRALFLLPDVDPDTETRMRDALLAQFAVVDARLVFEPGPTAERDAGERLSAMRAAARQHASIAAFSLDARGDARWSLYMLDVERDRLLVRSFDASPERRGAAIEAVALVAREATRALLEGVPMPEPPPEPPPPEPAPSPPPPSAAEPPPPPQITGVPTVRHPSAGDLRLWVAYDGTDFADEVAPRHAAALGAGWLGFEPWYAAASVELGPPIEVRDTVELAGPTPAAQSVAFQVTRVPLRLHLGHRYQQERVVLDLEVAVTAEMLHRSSDRNLTADEGVRIVPSVEQESTDWLVGVGPRARVEYQFVSWAGLAAELGFDALVNAKHFAYLARTPQGNQPLVRPHAVRPVWSLGIAFYP